MIKEKVKVDGENITLCADGYSVIQVWVNDDFPALLPLAYNGKLTIQLTAAGLEALEDVPYLRNCYIVKVEFVEDDGNRVF